MEYDTLYDLAQAGFRDWPWLFLGPAIVAAALAWRLWRKARGKTGAPSGFVMLMGGVAFAAVAATYWDHHRLVGHLQAGSGQVAEGLVFGHTVERVVTRTRNPGSNQFGGSVGSSSSSTTTWWETLRVGELAFGWHRRSEEVGLVAHNGQPVVLKDGQRLRITYVEDDPQDFTQRRVLRIERLRAQGAKGAASAASSMAAPAWRTAQSSR